MKKVFIVGAGQMGLDIGQVFAKTGYQVVYNDMSEEILATQVGKLEKSLTEGSFHSPPVGRQKRKKLKLWVMYLHLLV
mgnify:CR=1 FL=1